MQVIIEIRKSGNAVPEKDITSESDFLPDNNNGVQISEFQPDVNKVFLVTGGLGALGIEVKLPYRPINLDADPYESLYWASLNSGQFTVSSLESS